MARPTKCRRVCRFPDNLSFLPTSKECGEPIVLAIDEYETIRLIDREGLSQEECGVQLGVGRTTVQKIYDTARKKLAEALVLGLPLKIEGGCYSLCSGNTDGCYKKECCKNPIQTNINTEKGEATMRIAVTYQNGAIFQHFGHTEQFKIYDVENGEIVDSEIIDTFGSGHGALAGILSSIKTDVLICGGIGAGAQAALGQAGIRLYGGVDGDADGAVKSLIEGNLDFNPDVQCNHHEHRKDDGCGEHGCGHGQCGEH